MTTGTLVIAKAATTTTLSSNGINLTVQRGGSTEQQFTVIGVVKDARTITLAKPDPMIVFGSHQIG